jgi:hypothetical protein
MQRLPAILGCATLFLAAMAGRTPPGFHCRVTVRLVDAETRRSLPGLVRIVDGAGTVMHPGELMSRGTGLPNEQAIHDWSVVPRGEAEITLPATKVSFSAIAGLETERVEAEVDLTGKRTAEVTLALRRFSHLGAQGWRCGNTHLHLMKLTRAEADRYLREIPPADGLDLLFVSYLERADVDHEYVTNRYTREDLERLSTDAARFGWGEEHRHNFGHGGEGYGHVMLLDLKELVLPVSIGPGIMKRDTDGIPLQRGIMQARKDGATAIWCHNEWGMENLPNWVTGRLDAQNIFDGSIRSSYKDSFYKYLNAGLRVPFSTGTDWFLYDFSRVYVPVDGDVTARNWLAGLRAGKSFITNGPLLEFTAGAARIGERIDLDRAGLVPVSAKAMGRIDFRRLELVHNGVVIRTEPSRKVDGHYAAELKTTLPIDEPGWLAVRTPPPPVSTDPELSEPVERNESGQYLFSHSSPIYVSVAGKEVFDRAVVEMLKDRIERNLETIAREGQFADEEERERVLAVHREAIDILHQRLGERR